MNYYKHHLGDYAAATAHLSWDEDMAYSRLLRVYYQHERAIPADLKQACRLVRASRPVERAAVETVLAEFFTLEPDGWHQKRADAEIANAKDSAEENSAKTENERERQKRHRARRKTLFAALREHGIVPSWDTSTSELESRLSRVTGVTDDATGDAPGTRTATGIHKPLANNQDSDPNGSGDPAPTLDVPDPPDYAAIVWALGVTALSDVGIPERTARSFLGGLCAEWAEEHVASAVKAAVGKADPKGYMLGVLRERPKRHQGGLRLAI